MTPLLTVAQPEPTVDGGVWRYQAAITLRRPGRNPMRFVSAIRHDSEADALNLSSELVECNLTEAVARRRLDELRATEPSA